MVICEYGNIKRNSCVYRTLSTGCPVNNRNFKYCQNNQGMIIRKDMLLDILKVDKS